MLDRSNTGVSPHGVGCRHIPYSVKGSWEGLLQGDYVLNHGGSARGSCLCQLHLEGWLCFRARGVGDLLFKGWYGMGCGVWRAFVLCTIDGRQWLLEAYLAGCGLRQATKALGMGSAVWLVQVYQWVMENDMFCSLPQAAWGRGRDTKVIYLRLRLGHKIRDFKFQDP